MCKGLLPRIPQLLSPLTRKSVLPTFSGWGWNAISQQPLRFASVSSFYNGTKWVSQKREGSLSTMASSAIKFTAHWNVCKWLRKDLILLLPCLKPSRSLSIAWGSPSQPGLHTGNTWGNFRNAMSWPQPSPIKLESIGMKFWLCFRVFLKAVEWFSSAVKIKKHCPKGLVSDSLTSLARPLQPDPCLYL